MPIYLRGGRTQRSERSLFHVSNHMVANKAVGSSVYIELLSPRASDSFLLGNLLVVIASHDTFHAGQGLPFQNKEASWIGELLLRGDFLKRSCFSLAHPLEDMWWSLETVFGGYIKVDCHWYLVIRSQGCYYNQKIISAQQRSTWSNMSVIKGWVILP